MPSPLAARVRELMPAAREQLADLVAIPSVADPRQVPPEECRRAAEWVCSAFAAVGVPDVRLVDTDDGSAAVVGHAPGPAGAPTVLLYGHYDVQPPGPDASWSSSPWRLTERDGRWYGRGAADCKGNLVAHLVALGALGTPFPVGVRIVAEGSEEMGTGGLERLFATQPELFTADAILVCDVGNVAAGRPTVTTSLRGMTNVVVHVETLRGALHSGMYGGPAPDALAVLVSMLATLRDPAGDTTVRGVETGQRWTGVEYGEAQFRAEAGVLDGVELAGSGSVADMVWARPALTILGIDCPPVVGSAAAIQPRASARLNLRVPPGTNAAAAQNALVAHLEAAAPLNAAVRVEREGVGAPFRARTDGPAYAVLADAMAEAFGVPVGQTGEGGSIPLCTVFAETFPGRRDHAAGCGGAALPHPRTRRECRPRRARADRPDRGALPGPAGCARGFGRRVGPCRVTPMSEPCGRRPR